MTDHLVCSRQAEAGYVTPGSVAGACTQCHEPVWISPSGMQALRDRLGLGVLCTICLAGRQAAGDTEPVQLLGTAMQRAEIREGLRRRIKEGS